jgi:hypothetical protein
MAPAAVCHPEGLAAVAQTAVSSGFEGVCQLLTIMVVQGDCEPLGIRPQRSERIANVIRQSYLPFV